MKVFSQTVAKKVIFFLFKIKLIFIKYVNGMGNNLFQYFAIKFYNYNIDYKTIVLNSPSFNKFKLPNLSKLIAALISKLFYNFYDHNLINNDFNLKSINIFKGYGEILKIFEKHKLEIRKDFEKNIFNPKKPSFFHNNSYNIVIHLRLGDRFLRKNDYAPGMKYDFVKLKKVIANIKKKKLYL